MKTTSVFDCTTSVNDGRKSINWRKRVNARKEKKIKQTETPSTKKETKPTGSSNLSLFFPGQTEKLGDLNDSHCLATVLMFMSFECKTLDSHKRSLSLALGVQKATYTGKLQVRVTWAAMNENPSQGSGSTLIRADFSFGDFCLSHSYFEHQNLGYVKNNLFCPHIL